MGKRSGMEGPQSKGLHIWLAERRRRREEIIFHECTVDFQVEVFMQVLGDIYEVPWRMQCV